MSTHVLSLKKRTVPQYPAEQALTAFLLDGKARRLSPKTLYSYRQLIGYALTFLAEQGVTTLAEITPTHLRLWFVHLQERDWKENSVHAAAVALRAWLNWCVAEELLVDSPLRKVKMPRRSKELLPTFSDDDVRALLTACGDSLRDRALVLLLLDTGVRASECVALNVGDVSPDGAVSVQKGKGGKGRVTFLGSQAGRAVRRWLLSRPDSDPMDALWISENTGERLTRGGLQQVLERIGRRAGVAHSTAHTYRRTFALMSLRRGMDVVSLSRILGHADLSVIRRYLDQNREDLREAHRQHGPVDALLAKGKAKR